MKTQALPFIKPLHYYPIERVLGIILGGGVGSRLYPLTKERSKPAVPFAGNYRLIDIPISNCIYSGVNRIFVLTQFNSASLNRHINYTYKFDIFHQGSVEVLASEETLENLNCGFPHGTAEAVRKALRHIRVIPNAEYVLILAGDQLYNMDFREMLAYHIETQADITIGVLPVLENAISRFGIVRMDAQLRAIDFQEKPSPEKVQGWHIPKSVRRIFKREKYYSASMNMYLLRLDFLENLLVSNPQMLDFGKEVFPFMIPNYQVRCFLYEGFWDDIGTIKTFHQANIDLTKPFPHFSLYNETRPIFSEPRFLPPSKINSCKIRNAILSDGIMIEKSRITNSVVGIRSIVKKGCIIDQTVIMGNDYYETLSQRKRNRELNIPDIGIGRECEIRNAIIDKNCRIGNQVKIINVNNISYKEDPEGRYVIQDGIVVIPKGTLVPDGSVI